MCIVRARSASGIQDGEGQVLKERRCDGSQTGFVEMNLVMAGDVNDSCRGCTRLTRLPVELSVSDQKLTIWV